MSIEPTDERILRAAYELLLEESDPSLGMAKIAKRAGVSRQAVYLHFSSRGELMLALVDWTDEYLGLMAQLRELSKIEDSHDRLETALRIGAWFEPQLHDVVVAFEAARHTDEAIRVAWDDRMESRRGVYRRMLEPIAAEEGLRNGVTVERGAEVIWNLSCPTSYQNLVLDCGWTVEEWADWLVAAVKLTLLKP